MAIGNLGTLLVRIGADSRALTTGLLKATADITKFQATVTKGLRITQRVAPTAVFTTLGLELIKITRTGIAFEKQMAQIAVTARGTVDEISALEDTIRGLGLRTAEAAAALSDAGFSAAETAQALPQVATLAKAANLDLARASQIAATAVINLGIPIERLAETQDALIRTTQRTRINIETLGQSLGFAAPSIRRFGEDTKTAIAILGSLRSVGVAESLLGPTFVSLLQDASNAVNDFGLKGKDLLSILEELRETGATLSDFEAIFGPRGGLVAFDLSRNTQSIRDLREELDGVEGVAEKLAAAQKGTTAGLIAGIQKDVDAIGLTLFASFSKSLREGVRSVRDFVTDNKREFAAFAAFVGEAIGVVGRTVGGLVSTLFNVTSSIGSALLELASVLPLLNFDRVLDAPSFTAKIGETIRTLLLMENTFQRITVAAELFVAITIENFRRLIDFIPNLFRDIGSRASDLFGNIRGALGSIGDIPGVSAVVGPFREGIDAVERFFDAILEGSEKSLAVIDVAGRIVPKFVAGRTKEEVDRIIGALEGITDPLVQGVVNGLRQEIEAIKSLLDSENPDIQDLRRKLEALRVGAEEIKSRPADEFANARIVETIVRSIDAANAALVEQQNIHRAKRAELEAQNRLVRSMREREEAEREMVRLQQQNLSALRQFLSLGDIPNELRERLEEELIRLRFEDIRRQLDTFKDAFDLDETQLGQLQTRLLQKLADDIVRLRETSSEARDTLREFGSAASNFSRAIASATGDVNNAVSRFIDASLSFIRAIDDIVRGLNRLGGGPGRGILSFVTGEFASFKPEEPKLPSAPAPRQAEPEVFPGGRGAIVRPPEPPVVNVSLPAPPALAPPVVNVSPPEVNVRTDIPAGVFAAQPPTINIPPIEIEQPPQPAAKALPAGIFFRPGSESRRLSRRSDFPDSFKINDTRPLGVTIRGVDPPAEASLGAGSILAGLKNFFDPFSLVLGGIGTLIDFFRRPEPPPLGLTAEQRGVGTFSPLVSEKGQREFQELVDYALERDLSLELAFREKSLDNIRRAEEQQLEELRERWARVGITEDVEIPWLSDAFRRQREQIEREAREAESRAGIIEPKNLFEFLDGLEFDREAYLRALQIGPEFGGQPFGGKVSVREEIIGAIEEGFAIAARQPGIVVEKLEAFDSVSFDEFMSRAGTQQSLSQKEKTGGNIEVR